MTAAERLRILQDDHHPSRPLKPAIMLTAIHQDLLDQLIERVCRSTGQSPEDVRREVELRVLALGIDALQQELGKA